MKLLTLSCLTALLTLNLSLCRAEAVSLDVLIEQAIADDPLLERSAHTGNSFRHQAVAAGELPDPAIAISLANLPTDTFDFSQEPMTQVSLGITQFFPGGDTRGLQQEKFEQMSQVSRLDQAVRRARVGYEVTAGWLRLREARLAIATIEGERQLFDQLLSSTAGNYESATGRVNQQDLIRAQLEVTRLDERILNLQEQSDRSLQELSALVPAVLLDSQLDWTLPSGGHGNALSLLTHPEVVRIDQQIAVARTEVSLARESRRPGYRVNASYGYRDQDFLGRDLPDFVSVGVSMDLPLFPGNRQDRQVAAAADRTSALESARTWKLRELSSRRASARASLQQLTARQQLYEDTLLSQSDALARAALDAYSADQGDFADVMRAYIARLNARIDLLGIETRRAQLGNELDYLNTTVATAPEGQP